MDKIKGKKIYELVDSLEVDDFTAKSNNKPETKNINLDLEPSDLKSNQSQAKMVSVQITCLQLVYP